MVFVSRTSAGVVSMLAGSGDAKGSGLVGGRGLGRPLGEGLKVSEGAESLRLILAVVQIVCGWVGRKFLDVCPPAPQPCRGDGCRSGGGGGGGEACKQSHQPDWLSGRRPDKDRRRPGERRGCGRSLPVGWRGRSLLRLLLLRLLLLRLRLLIRESPVGAAEGRPAATV